MFHKAAWAILCLGTPRRADTQACIVLTCTRCSRTFPNGVVVDETPRTALKPLRIAARSRADAVAPLFRAHSCSVLARQCGCSLAYLLCGCERVNEVVKARGAGARSGPSWYKVIKARGGGPRCWGLALEDNQRSASWISDVDRRPQLVLCAPTLPAFLSFGWEEGGREGVVAIWNLGSEPKHGAGLRDVVPLLFESHVGAPPPTAAALPSTGRGEPTTNSICDSPALHGACV